MKKICMLVMIAFMTIMASCGSSVDKEKVNELLNKETKDLTSDDIIVLLDNMDGLIDELSGVDVNNPSDKDKENAELCEKIEKKIEAWGEMQEAAGKEVPENVMKKAQQVYEHMQKVMEKNQK